MVGNALHLNASRYLSPGGSALVWIFVALVGMQLAGNISWFNVAARVLHWAQARLAARAGNATGPVVAESRTEGDGGKPRWSLTDLHLPSPEFWKRLRDRLGNIQPTADSLPDVFEEQKNRAARQQANEPAAPRADADDPFAVAEDINGVPISPDVSADAAYAAGQSGNGPAHNPAHDQANDLEQDLAPDDTAPAAASAATARSTGGIQAPAFCRQRPKRGLTGLLSAHDRPRGKQPFLCRGIF